MTAPIATIAASALGPGSRSQYPPASASAFQRSSLRSGCAIERVDRRR
jgi:hypothetical protein